jgi:1-acyl-sn-glycerol-3-phosphate acyltransferase
MNSTVNPVRLRLALLWLAVFARAVAAYSVITYGLVDPAGRYPEPTVGLLFLVLGLSAVPALALAPLAGALACSRGRWVTMIVSTLAGLAIIAFTSIDDFRTGRAFWPGCIAVLAVDAAFFSVCTFAIVPQASRDARFHLTQVLGLFAVASAAGLFLGSWIGVEKFHDGKPGLAVPLQVGHIGYGVALVCILLARFSPQTPIRVNDGLVVPFLRTARTIFRERGARNSLFALWGLFLIALAVSQWLMPVAARYHFYLALVMGVVVSGIHHHPFRIIGIAPLAALGILVCAIIGQSESDWHGPAVAMALFIGLAYVPLLTAFQVNQSEATRGHGGALLHAGWSLLTFALLAVLLTHRADPSAAKLGVGRAVLVLAIIGALFAVLVFFREMFEFIVGLLLFPMYQVRAFGPGAHQLPWRGPVLVIANHAAWLDPLFLGKFVPAPITPMMISRFYDLPVISWFVRKVVGAIRVPDVAMRKDAPEINEAIAALDRGKCVIIFPEAWLRRKEESELRRFGRGIWQILKARPNTPIFACWIDGNWGSFFSFKNGPPMKNKRIDILRKIRVAVLEPFCVDTKTLEEHMATRTALMKKVLEARALFGLPPIDPFKVHARDEDNADDKEREGAS